MRTSGAFTIRFPPPIWCNAGASPRRHLLATPSIMASVIPTAPRRARAVLGVLVALLLTTAARPGPVSPAELRVGVARLPAMLDPMAALTPTELMLVRLVFEGLVAVGDKGEIEPALASGWTLSRDGLTW